MALFGTCMDTRQPYQGSVGRYYGRERNKLYALTLDDTHTIGYYSVRAPDRQSLRKLLKRLYLEAKVGQ